MGRWMMATDCLGAVLALLVAYQLRFQRLWPPTEFLLVLLSGLVMTAAFYMVLGLYRAHQYSSAEEFRRILLAVSMTVNTIVLASLSTASSSRFWAASAWGLDLMFALSSRRLWHRHVWTAWSRGELTFRTVIVGTNDEAQRLAELMRTKDVGFRPLGFVSTGSPELVRDQLPLLGSVHQLRELVRRTQADCVFVAATAMQADDMKHVLKARRLDGVEIRVTSNFPSSLSAARLTPQSIGGLIAFSVNAVCLTRAQAIAKRTFDVVVSAAVLVVVSPLLIVLGIAIKLTSRGPVLFRQERVGLHGKCFTMLKLRTMLVGADLMLDKLRGLNEASGPLFKLRHDPRVTGVGRWLRRVSLDELPQLWNVLKGEMSLVGPRPALPEEVQKYQEWQLGRLEVRPGITGLWQVSGRSELSFNEYVRLDLFYIENWSIAYDLFIVAKTVPMMLRARGAY